MLPTISERLIDQEKCILADLNAHNSLNLLTSSKGSFYPIVCCYDEVTSTMDVAKEVIAKELELKFAGKRTFVESQNLEEIKTTPYGLVLAQNQTNGRGRIGRPWESAGKAFLGTFFFATKNEDPNTYSGFSLVVGLSLVRVLSNFTKDLRVKWPNDIYSLNGKKLSGTLIEFAKISFPVSKSANDSIQYALVGVGINLSNPPATQNSISLKDLTGLTVSPSELSSMLLIELFNLKDLFEQQGFKHFKSEWLKNSYNLNQEISVTQGMEKITGVFKDVLDTGELVLGVEGGEVLVR